MTSALTPDHPAPLRVAFVGSFPPRRCGIASFTADLAVAVRRAQGRVWIAQLAVDPAWEHIERRPPYAGGVDTVHPIVLEQREAYLRAADWANRSGVEVVSIQHEYGLFGGDQGDYVLELVRHLRVPVVTTLHTVLRHPNTRQREVLAELARLSRVVVAQARTAVDLMERLYGVEPAHMMVIPHGTPEFALTERDEAKRRLGLSGREVLLTYGLLSPGKGIEQALRALPLIVRRFPSVLYVVAGQTHPNVKKFAGERYRDSLRDMAEELGVSGNVQFLDRYLELDELGRLLSATDVYVLPYPNEDQVVSGTLSYAMAAGKAVVSTPFRYAREVMGPGRGLFCQFGSPESLASEVLRLLSGPDLRRTLEHRARALGQSMSWEIVGSRYARLFRWAASEARERRGAAAQASGRATWPYGVPVPPGAPVPPNQWRKLQTGR